MDFPGSDESTQASPTFEYQLTYPAQTATPTSWKTFTDSQLGYSIQYPGDWYLYEPTHPTDSIVYYDLIISDAPGNISPQGRTEDENGRISLSYTQNQEEPLEVWIVSYWSELNSEILPATLSNHRGWSVTYPTYNPSGNYSIYWLDVADTYFIIETYSESSGIAIQRIQEILSTLTFNG